MEFYLDSDKAQIRMKKTLSVILILTMLLTGIMGCGNGGEPEADPSRAKEDTNPYEHDYKQGEFGIVEDFDRELWLPEPDEENQYSVTEVLSAEDGNFTSEEVEFSVDSLFLEKDAQLDITRMKAPEPIEGAEVNAFSFSLSDTDYNGIYEISIPYDPNAGDEVGAGYFNEDTKTWEPVMHEVDEENNRVIISTSHLSTFSSFIIEGEGNRMAIAKSRSFQSYSNLHSGEFDYAAVITDSFGDEITPGGKAYDLGKDVIDEWFMYTDAILEFEGVAYSSEFLSDLSNAFGNIGLALSIAQLSIDYSRGDNQAMGVEAFNTAQGLAIGKWGTKALQVSMIGVTAIDYSLSRLREDMIDGREEIWYEAYRMYYRDHGRSHQDWYYRLKEIYDNISQPDRFEYVLEAELENYVYKFWDGPEVDQAAYQTEAMDQGITLGGGLNEALKDEIAEYYKQRLLKNDLRPVFDRLENEIREEQVREYYDELDRAKEKLNQVVDFEIQEVVPEDEEPKYAGYYAKFAPLSEEADKRQWIGWLNEDGYVSSSFTVLGHLLAGAPDEIRLYETLEDMEEGNVAYVEDFVVDVPHTRIKIGEIIEGDLEGEWEGTFTITSCALAEIDPESMVQNGNVSEDADILDDGCEMELDEAVAALIVGFFKSIVDSDVPMTMVFDSTGNENEYIGEMILKFQHIDLDLSSLDMGGENISSEDMGLEEQITSATATVEDGKITIIPEQIPLIGEEIESGEVSMHYSGVFEDENKISGTFEAPLDSPTEVPGTGQVFDEFWSGDWGAIRIEE